MHAEQEMKRRTNYERVQTIFDYITEQEKVFKTDFEKKGFNVNSVSEWMKIIQYIQSQPKIRTFKKGRITIYEFEK